MFGCVLGGAVRLWCGNLTPRGREGGKLTAGDGWRFCYPGLAEAGVGGTVSGGKAVVYCMTSNDGAGREMVVW